MNDKDTKPIIAGQLVSAVILLNEAIAWNRQLIGDEFVDKLEKISNELDEVINDFMKKR